MSFLIAVSMALGAVLLWQSQDPPSFREGFDGGRAYSHVMTQLSFGPRIPGTEGNRKAGDYIAEQLKLAGWSVEFQEFKYMNMSIRNLIARANLGRGPIIVLGAHYDTRRWADQDTTFPRDPVPGANDGASGVAVLLELARVLDLGRIRHEIWLAFFDAEDNGGIDGWDWIVGSTHMAGSLSTLPRAMILVDMVGDADQQIYLEANSDEALSQKIWATAAQLGYGNYFRPEVRWHLVDDHIPFARLGVPAVDIIDFDYEYWHTTADTADKISPESLERVGRTLLTYLETLE
jgi:Zn-dependent M28 family amino/carboxypeptidase